MAIFGGMNCFGWPKLRAHDLGHERQHINTSWWYMISWCVLMHKGNIVKLKLNIYLLVDAVPWPYFLPLLNWAQQHNSLSLELQDQLPEISPGRIQWRLSSHKATLIWVALMQVEAKAHFNHYQSISTLYILRRIIITVYYFYAWHTWLWTFRHMATWHPLGCIARPYDTRYVNINLKSNTCSVYTHTHSHQGGIDVVGSIVGGVTSNVEEVGGVFNRWQSIRTLIYNYEQDIVNIHGYLSLYLFFFATMLFLANAQSSLTGFLHTEPMNWTEHMKYIIGQVKLQIAVHNKYRSFRISRATTSP